METGRAVWEAGDVCHQVHRKGQRRLAAGQRPWSRVRAHARTRQLLRVSRPELRDACVELVPSSTSLSCVDVLTLRARPREAPCPRRYRNPGQNLIGDFTLLPVVSPTVAIGSHREVESNGRYRKQLSAAFGGTRWILRAVRLLLPSATANPAGTTNEPRPAGSIAGSHVGPPIRLGLVRCPELRHQQHRAPLQIYGRCWRGEC
jgi:hypothetical protein